MMIFGSQPLNSPPNLQISLLTNVTAKELASAAEIEAILEDEPQQARTVTSFKRAFLSCILLHSCFAAFLLASFLPASMCLIGCCSIDVQCAGEGVGGSILRGTGQQPGPERKVGNKKYPPK
jgi:hypothetical protein